MHMSELQELLKACRKESREGGVTGGLLSRLAGTIENLKAEREGVCAKNAKLETLVQSIPDIVARFDAEGRFTYVTPRIQTFTGHAPQQLLGKTHREAGFAASICDLWESQFKQINSARCDLCFDWVFTNPKGEERRHTVRLRPDVNAQTGQVQCILCISRDITDAWQAQEALRQSEEKFRLLVSGVREYALFLLDPVGHIVSWNSGAERIKGYKAQEIIGRHFSVCYVADDVKECRPERDLQEAEQAGQCRHEGWMVRKDGSRFWADMLITALRNDDGSLRGFAEVTRDMTERRRDEQALVLAKEQAEAANRAKDEFIAVLSHELRTPLTPVLAAVSMLADEARESSAQAEELALIQRNIELEARLIDDLLDLTRISRGKIELRREPLDVHAALNQTLEICLAEIRNKSLNVRLDLKATSHNIYADPARVQQVFWNLLKNAIKFTAEGGAVLLRTTNPEKGVLRIQVIDNGIGIEPEMMPRLFRAFEQGQTTGSRRFGGLGLGLTISKTIVDMHGGTLSASSEGKGHGATFTVDFTTTSISPQPAAAPAAPHSPRNVPVTVLFVEDQEDTRKIMARMLKRLGYAVKTAADVHEALAIVEHEPIDILVSDLGLPDGSGWDIMRQVKAHSTIRGIALSGYGMDEDVARSEASGFSRHLTKPINPQDLNAAICQLVAAH